MALLDVKNLTKNFGGLTVVSGARLQTGVYLYRVRLSSGGAVKESKAK